MVCHPVKCKELVFRKSNYNDNIAQIHNIRQCIDLRLLGVTFQSSCKYNVHVKSKLIKANKYLFILRSLRKEGVCQEGVDRFFNTVVLPNFTYGLSVYGAHRRSQDFSKGGSHCVKVRVLVCLDIFKLKRHSTFATCSRLFS